MSIDVTGIITPIQTPFSEEGNLRLENVADSVEYALTCGSDAVVAAGTGVQETTTLAPAERKELITETVQAVDGRVPVFAGCAYPARPVATDLARHAADEGADALLSFPPWGVTPTSQTVINYYEALAAATDLPVLMYNNPTITVDMSAETMIRVAKLDGIEFVKETSRNYRKISSLLEHIQRPGLADVFVTYDVLLPALQAGAAGAVVPTPASTPAVQVHRAFLDDDLDSALGHQETLTRFPPPEIDASGLLPVMKAGAEIAGVDVGPPRNPYDVEALTRDERDALKRWMDNNNVPQLG